MLAEGASFRDVSEPGFHFVCVPSALVGLPAEWVTELLGDGEIALLADDGGFAAINEVAHALGLISVSLLAARGDAGAPAANGDGIRRSPSAGMGRETSGHRLAPHACR